MSVRTQASSSPSLQPFSSSPSSSLSPSSTTVGVKECHQHHQQSFATPALSETLSSPQARKSRSRRQQHRFHKETKAVITSVKEEESAASAHRLPKERKTWTDLSQMSVDALSKMNPSVMPPSCSPSQFSFPSSSTVLRRGDAAPLRRCYRESRSMEILQPHTRSERDDWEMEEKRRKRVTRRYEVLEDVRGMAKDQSNLWRGE